MEIKGILVTTDFSRSAKDAYPAAATLARKFGAAIHLVHVAEPISQRLFLPDREKVDLSYELYLEDIEERLVKDEGGDQVFHGLTIVGEVVVEDDPYEALGRLARSRDVALLITASHGHSGIEFVRLGSFTRNLIRFSDIPVLTVRTPSGTGKGDTFRAQKILAPLDFSPNSRAVLPLLQTLASAYSSEVTFLYVSEPLPAFSLSRLSELFGGEFKKLMRDAASLAASEFDKIRQEHLPGTKCRLEMRDGTPYEEILRYAQEESTDVILMTTVGATDAKHIFLGSVAERVTRRAPCPVFTVSPSRRR